LWSRNKFYKKKIPKNKDKTFIIINATPPAISHLHYVYTVFQYEAVRLSCYRRALGDPRKFLEDLEMKCKLCHRSTLRHHKTTWLDFRKNSRHTWCPQSSTVVCPASLFRLKNGRHHKWPKLNKLRYYRSRCLWQRRVRLTVRDETICHQHGLSDHRIVKRTDRLYFSVKDEGWLCGLLRFAG
jgi:hypothetical protein